jgi:hypothetical protein
VPTSGWESGHASPVLTRLLFDEPQRHIVQEQEATADANDNEVDDVKRVRVQIHRTENLETQTCCELIRQTSSWWSISLESRALATYFISWNAECDIANLHGVKAPIKLNLHQPCETPPEEGYVGDPRRR